MTRLLERSKFLSKQYSIRILIPLVFLSLLLVVSCSKPAGLIGIDIQPEDSKLNLRYTDTVSVYAYSTRLDSVRSDYLTWNGIGSLMDPVFGNTNVGFYTQLFLSKTGQEFGTDRVVDSLILQLDYSGAFADTNTVLTAHVYEMSEGLDAEEIYYSNLNLDLYPYDYGDISFEARPNDSVIVDDELIAPVLRLNLSEKNPALAEKLLNATVEQMEDSEIFRDYFKGLFVIAEPVAESGCIAEFDLTSPRSRLTLYFHNSEAGEEGLVFDYNITTASARVAKYEHDFNTGSTDFQQQVVEGDTMLGADKFYVQGYGGVKSIIKVPYIDKWRDLGFVAINEAKLILNGYETEPLWGAPSQVAIYAIDENGNDQYLIDSSEGDSYFGGFYYSPGNNYTFRITRYLQSIINDHSIKHYGFSLYVTSPWLVPNRFIYNGNESDSTSRIKMEVLYTDLN